MVFILDPFLISPPDGLDSAQILSKFQLQFLRLMALPGIEESSYLGNILVDGRMDRRQYEHIEARQMGASQETRKLQHLKKTSRR